MAGYARVLKDGAAVVLAEPGAVHETAAVSVDTMAKYGILEKGMELEDVERYIAGSPFAEPEQHYVLHASADALHEGIDLASAWRHSIFHGNLFRIRKDASRIAPSPDAGAPRRTRAPSNPQTFEELRVVHEHAVRESTAAIERLSGQVHTATLDLHAARAAAVIAQRTVADMERSVFWKVRRCWVRLARIFGSHRGDTRPADHLENRRSGDQEI